MITITDLLEITKNKRIKAIIDNDQVCFYEIDSDGSHIRFNEDKNDYYPEVHPRDLLYDILEILNFEVDYA